MLPEVQGKNQSRASLTVDVTHRCQHKIPCTPISEVTYEANITNQSTTLYAPAFRGILYSHEVNIQ